MPPNPFDFVEQANCKHAPPCDLLQWNKDDMPIGPGVYILLARQSFEYPRGSSPVFYIGKADRLRRRLRQHKRGILRASGDRKHAIYLPPYEYGATFGANVAVIHSTEPQQTEFLLLAHFAKMYRSLPVANNAVNRRKLRRLFATPPGAE